MISRGKKLVQNNPDALTYYLLRPERIEPLVNEFFSKNTDSKNQNVKTLTTFFQEKMELPENKDLRDLIQSIPATENYYLIYDAPTADKTLGIQGLYEGAQEPKTLKGDNGVGLALQNIVDAKNNKTSDFEALAKRAFAERRMKNGIPPDITNNGSYQAFFSEVEKVAQQEANKGKIVIAEEVPGELQRYVIAQESEQIPRPLTYIPFSDSNQSNYENNKIFLLRPEDKQEWKKLNEASVSARKDNTLYETAAYENLVKVLRNRYKQDGEFRKALTDSGEAFLCYEHKTDNEKSTEHDYWPCRPHIWGALGKSEHVNMFGKALMQVREENKPGSTKNLGGEKDFYKDPNFLTFEKDFNEKKDQRTEEITTLSHGISGTERNLDRGMNEPGPEEMGQLGTIELYATRLKELQNKAPQETLSTIRVEPTARQANRVRAQSVFSPDKLASLETDLGPTWNRTPVGDDNLAYSFTKRTATKRISFTAEVETDNNNRVKVTAGEDSETVEAYEAMLKTFIRMNPNVTVPIYADEENIPKWKNVIQKMRLQNVKINGEVYAPGAAAQQVRQPVADQPVPVEQSPKGQPGKVQGIDPTTTKPNASKTQTTPIPSSAAQPNKNQVTNTTSATTSTNENANNAQTITSPRR